jgi:hypothetical protein
MLLGKKYKTVKARQVIRKGRRILVFSDKRYSKLYGQTIPMGHRSNGIVFELKTGQQLYPTDGKGNLFLQIPGQVPLMPTQQKPRDLLRETSPENKVSYSIVGVTLLLFALSLLPPKD